MPVDEETVEHVATLARVDLEEDERRRFTEQFDEILSYFDALEDVPAVDSEPPLQNVLREDKKSKSLSQEEALSNAPETEDGYFKGPNVS